MKPDNPNRCRHCGNAPELSCVTTPDDYEEWTVKCPGCSRGPSKIYQTRDDARQAWIDHQAEEKDNLE